MIRTVRWTFVIAVLLGCAPRAQMTSIAPREIVRIPPGTLGVVRVLQSVGEFYDCEISFALAFPADTMAVRVAAEPAGPLTLFDDKGPIGVLGVGSGIAVQPVCGDGKGALRPTLRTTLRREELDRALVAHEPSGIAAFVVVSDAGKVPELEAAPDSADVVRRGDVNGDGRMEAVLLRASGACASIRGADSSAEIMECCAP